MSTGRKSQLGKFCAITGIAFVAYNLIFSAACCGTGIFTHGVFFWLAYVFMMLTFPVALIEALITRKVSDQPKDWLFGCPVFIHIAVYMVTELLVSTLCMLLDSIVPWGFWWIPFGLQTLLLAVHVIFVISSFIAKDKIKEIDLKVSDATSFIKLLKVDVEVAASKTEDAETKAALMKLAEQVRFSDPISNETLFELEKQIALHVNNADSCIVMGDLAGAKTQCARAAQLLAERNQRCKALK